MTKDNEKSKEQSVDFEKKESVFYDLLEQVTVGISTLNTTINALNTVNAMLENESNQDNVKKLLTSKRKLEAKIEQQVINVNESGLYKELSEVLKVSSESFAPPDLYKRKGKRFTKEKLFENIKSHFSKESAKESIDPSKIEIDDLNNYSLEQLEELILFIKSKQSTYANIEYALKKMLNETDNAQINQKIEELDHIISISLMAQQLYLDKRKAKIEKISKESQLLSFDQIKELYKRLGLLDNFKDKEGFGDKSIQEQRLSIFLKEYLLIFSRLQYIHDMDWNDKGSKFARGSLIKPRDVISELQILFNQFENKKDLIDVFWENEVGRHKLTWELSTNTKDHKGLVVYKKGFFGRKKEQISGDVKLVMVADKWYSHKSGLIKLENKKGIKYFQANAVVDGQNIGKCLVEVGDDFQGQKSGDIIELSGEMDVVATSQKASDRDLATRQWGSYPSEFNLTPEYEDKVAKSNEGYLYSNILHQKLIAMRIDRKSQPDILSPLQRKEKYSILFYYGDKVKKIFVTDEDIQSSAEIFYQSLVNQGIDFDNLNTDTGYKKVDNSKKTREENLKQSYTTRDYIQDVQDEIADPDNFEACDLAFVVTDDKKFIPEMDGTSFDENLNSFEDLLSDIRVSNNGVKKMESIVVNKSIFNHGKITSVSTLTNHSSADGVSQVKETQDVFKKAVDISREMTISDQKKWLNEYEKKLRQYKIADADVVMESLKVELDPQYGFIIKVSKHEEAKVPVDFHHIDSDETTNFYTISDPVDFTDFISIVKKYGNINEFNSISELKEEAEIENNFDYHDKLLGHKSEQMVEFDFPIQDIRDMLEVEIGDTGQTLYAFLKQRYGIKFSLTNILPFVDIILAETNRWTFLSKKENGRLVPSSIFFPEYLQDQVDISSMTGKVEKIDFENLVMQFFQFEIDKNNINADEGSVPTFARVASNGMRMVSRFIGNPTDGPITDVFQNNGMQSTMVSARGHDYYVSESGEKLFTHEEGLALEQKKFATAVNSYSRLGVTASTEYLKIVGTDDDDYPIYEPHIYISYRYKREHNKFKQSAPIEYEEKLRAIINFFTIAANNEANGWN